VAGDRHGGAPKGERVGRGFARRDPRVTRAAHTRACRRDNDNKKAPVGAPPTLRFGGHEANVQNPGAEMRRGNEVGRRRQGYGGLDHLTAEASAKAGGLFDIVKVARGTRGPLCPVVLAKAGTHDHGPVIMGPGSPLRGRRPGRGLVEHFGETKPIAVSLETEPARSLTLPPPIHRFRALSPRAETRTADRPRRPEATARQRDAPSGAIGVCKPSS
jgi:hypothetical protein